MTNQHPPEDTRPDLPYRCRDCGWRGSNAQVGAEHSADTGHWTYDHHTGLPACKGSGGAPEPTPDLREAEHHLATEIGLIRLSAARPHIALDLNRSAQNLMIALNQVRAALSTPPSYERALNDHVTTELGYRVEELEALATLADAVVLEASNPDVIPEPLNRRIVALGAWLKKHFDVEVESGAGGAPEPTADLREALERIVALQAKWDAKPTDEGTDRKTNTSAWAAVGSDAHKIATLALSTTSPEPTQEDE